MRDRVLEVSYTCVDIQRLLDERTGDINTLKTELEGRMVPKALFKEVSQAIQAYERAIAHVRNSLTACTDNQLDTKFMADMLATVQNNSGEVAGLLLAAPKKI